MTPSPVGGSIHVTLSGSPRLRLGETVVVRVIKELGGGKWAVGVRGRVYPALSDLALEPGSVLKARVGATGGRLVLTISSVEPDAVATALAAGGLPPGGAEEIIARALARSGLPLVADTIQKLRTLLARAGLDERKAARSAATLIDKRIDPGSPGAASLLRVIAFGQKGGEDPRRYRGRPLPEKPREVKEYIGSVARGAGPSASRPSILQPYNHLAGKSQTWVVIPFVFTSEGARVEGTLKILFDAFAARPLALSLCTSDVSLHVPLQGRRRTLSVFCDSPATRRAAARGLDTLRSKFHNMGLEVDDTIKEGNAFDGFSPIEEGEILPRVDTVG
jgi:hypothetical protein